MTKRGSIELARSQCEAIEGELPDGEQYGSVDVAEILSGHVETLESMCERLIVALSRYGVHEITECYDENGEVADCRCGLIAALAEWEQSK